MLYTYKIFYNFGFNFTSNVYNNIGVNSLLLAFAAFKKQIWLSPTALKQ